MTKIDFIHVAEAIGKAWVISRSRVKENKEFTQVIDLTMERLIEAMDESFSLDNPKFDRKRFDDVIAQEFTKRFSER